MKELTAEKWETLPLGELCEFRRGLTYKKGDEVETGGTPVLRANNVDLAKGELDLEEIRYIDPAIEVPKPKKVVAGSLLICTASGSKKHLGKTALIEDKMDFAFGGFMGLLVPRPTILPRYLQWLLRSDVYWSFIDGLSDGANINNLKFKQLAEFLVPLPPLEEQKRIVAVLDTAFEGLARARAHAEANLQNARELFESQLSDLFTHPDPSWNRAPLSEYCEKVTVGHVGPMAKRYVSSGTPFLRSQNVRPFKIDLTDVKYIDADFTNELGKSELRPGDVAIVRTGYPGTCAVIPDDLPLANCADLVIARTGPRLSPHFLALLLNSTYGKELVAGAAVGAAQKHFNVGAAKKAVFPFPPLEEQERLVLQANKISASCDKLVRIAEYKIQDLEDLRQSLLQKAFAGELT